MAKFISVSDNELNLIIEFYKQQITANDAAIAKLQYDMDMLSFTNANLEDKIYKYGLLIEYNVNWTYEEKVKFALNKNSESLSVNEIISFLKLCGDTGMEDKVKNLSSILHPTNGSHTEKHDTTKKLLHSSFYIFYQPCV